MILNGPTGLWRTVLPTEPNDAGSVVYTISSIDPPRSELLFLKIPAGIEQKQRPIKSFTLRERRLALGDLIFVLSIANASKAASSMPAFKIGEVLEFENSTSEDIEPMLVGRQIETQHDIYRIDNDLMGITNEQDDTISDEAGIAQTILLNEIRELRIRYSDFEIDIKEQQKVINERNKVINGLDAILSINADAQIAAIKIIQQENLVNDRSNLDALIESLNIIPNQIGAKVDELNNLSVFIK